MEGDGFSRRLFAVILCDTRIVALRRIAGIAALLIGWFVVTAWILRPSETAGPCALVNGPVALPGLIETSGLAVGRRNPDLLWSHNDSGNAAVLFALDTKGALKGQVRVPVATRDWEDVSAARCDGKDCLYIADIGDNGRVRQQVPIYRVPEPSPSDVETARPEVFTATYADGPHNAEAMFVIGDDLFIVTRDRTGLVYRSRIVSGSHGLRFERVAQLNRSQVSDAETSTDGSTVAVRTVDDVGLYRTVDVLAGKFAPYLSIPIAGLREAQGEAVALDGNMLYLSSEGGFIRGGSFVSLRCSLPK